MESEYRCPYFKNECESDTRSETSCNAPFSILYRIGCPEFARLDEQRSAEQLEGVFIPTPYGSIREAITKKKFIEMGMGDRLIE